MMVCEHGHRVNCGICLAELASLRDRLAAAETKAYDMAHAFDLARDRADAAESQLAAERQARERAEAALADVARMACPGRGYTMQDIRKRALAAAPAHPGTEGDPRP